MRTDQNWIYKVVELKAKLLSRKRDKDIEESINKLGAQGWELVSVSQHSVTYQTMCYFKKPRG